MPRRANGDFLVNLGRFELNEIYTGDARELAKDIPDESVDLIFTDPPYLKKYLPLYEWLFREGKRILQPDGFILAYTGGFWKDEIMFMARAADIKYFWDYQVIMKKGSNSIIWPRKTIAISKSILAYRKNGGMPRTNVLGAWSDGEQDKRYHVWGQDESTARYYIDCFSKPGDIVFDPFVGGGTTAAVCKLLQRNFLAFEILEDQAEIARARVTVQQPYLPHFSQQFALTDGDGSYDTSCKD